jgi:hypothetical protein
MGKMKSYLMEVEDLVVEAQINGAETAEQVRLYVNDRLPAQHYTSDADVEYVMETMRG